MSLCQLSRSQTSMSSQPTNRDDDQGHDPARTECPSPEETGPASAFDVLQFAAQFDFVVPESVLTNLDAQTKPEAVRAMVASLAASGALPETEQDQITATILRREELASTGVGAGIAIPHAKHAALEHAVATIAYCPKGLEFSSLDGKPVHLLCLLLTPPDRHREQIMALQALAKQLRHLNHWR